MAVHDQILTGAQMRAAEAELTISGVSEAELMRRAGEGAAEIVRRISGGRVLTVLCGPGNNGGDGYILAEALRGQGAPVKVVAAAPPKTEAARAAAALYQGTACEAGGANGEVLVDCLYGAGLNRALSATDALTLASLAARHPLRVAIDLPSGITADAGTPLSPALPTYTHTLALGAWKPAHALMPAVAQIGMLMLIDIGIGAVAGAGRRLRQPTQITAPAADAHKYTRGNLLIIAGAMPGAAILAAEAALGAGAGYVRLASDRPLAAPPEIPVVAVELRDDEALSAMLVGSGLGTDAAALARLERAIALILERATPLVLDADALRLLTPKMLRGRVGMVPARLGPIIATPHEGEFKALEGAFGCGRQGTVIDRALALAKASGMVIVAKGPATVIAGPDGAWTASPIASSWLSTAGSGDVLAGIIASRVATGAPAFAAAAQGVWLHGEAARQAGAAFSARQLASAVRGALATCL